MNRIRDVVAVPVALHSKLDVTHILKESADFVGTPNANPTSFTSTTKLFSVGQLVACDAIPFT